MEKAFSVGAIIKESSAIIRKNFWGVIGQYFLIILISGLMQAFFGNAAFVGSILISYVVVKWTLTMVEKGSVTFDDLFGDLTFKKFIYFICTFVLVVIAIAWPMVAILFLEGFFYGFSQAMSGGVMNEDVITALAGVGILISLIPLILLYVPRMFAKFITIEHDLKPTKALKMSKKITKGVRAKLLWFLVLVVLINVLGLLCLVVGILYTAPLSAIAIALVYKKLSAQAMPQTEEASVVEEVIVEEIDVVAA